MVFPKQFFQLNFFTHKSIFLLNAPVWETLKELKKHLDHACLGKIECSISPGVTLVHPEKISIGRGSRLEPGSYIEGPCWIGKDCQIRHGAYVRPYVLTGDRCIIGHSTEVKHAIFLDDAQAPHFNYVGDSILGNKVNLGAGVVCANLRLDHGEVIVKIDKNLYKTGLKKFGAILGDRSQIGCNSVLNPGILLRKQTCLKGCSSIQKTNLRKRDYVAIS